MGDFRPDQTWVGAGIKGGGFLFVVGATTFEGAAGRLDTLLANAGVVQEVNVTELQIGIGLGGGVGCSLFFAFDCPTLWGMNNTNSDISFTFNVAIPGEKIGVGSATFNVLSGLSTVDKTVIASLNSVCVGELSDIAQMAYSGLQTSSGYSAGKNNWIVFDVPGAGWGAQVMLGGSAGQFSTLG
jgi:hypothetical protein